MRILVFYQYLCTPKGAYSTRWYEIARRLVARGHEVVIVTSKYDKSDLEPDGLISRQQIAGIDVILLNIRLSNGHGYARRIQSFAEYAALSTWFALSEPADVVIASSGPLTVALPAMAARWLRNIPMLFEARDLWPEGAIQMGVLKNRWLIAGARLLERASYRSASRIIACSPGMVPYFRERSPLPISIVTNGSDLDLFRPGLVPRAEILESCHKFTLLYAGTLGRIHNVGELLDLAEVLLRRGVNDVQLVLLGSGAEEAELKSDAARRQLTNVVFAGQRPKLEVAEWHAAAQVVTNVADDKPFLQTASPNKLFDGLAAGRPILNNIGGWIAEALTDAGAGVNYPVGDVEAAADALLALKQDPERLQRMGAAARRLAEREFGRESLVERYLEALGEVADPVAVPSGDQAWAG